MITRFFIPSMLLWLALQPAAAGLLFDIDQHCGTEDSPLTISQPADDPFEILAYESSGVVLADRIELRFPADLTLTIGQTQPGWTSQISIVTENLEQVGLATFFFSGLDVNDDAESFRFTGGWASTLSFTNSTGDFLQVPLKIDVFGSVELGGGGGVVLVREGASLNINTVSANPDPFCEWITGYYPAETDPAIVGRDANPSGDGLSNLLKFAFGLNPTISDSGVLSVTDAATFTNGQPTGHLSYQPFNFSARFVRLNEHAVLGMTYTVEFSSDLDVWAASTVSPTVVSKDGSDYEVVEVPRPFFVNGSKARFFRLKVTLIP